MFSLRVVQWLCCFNPKKLTERSQWVISWIMIIETEEFHFWLRLSGTQYILSRIYLSCLFCFLVTVLYDSRLVMCNIKAVCVKLLSVFATMLLCEEIMQSLCTFTLCFFHCLLLSTVLHIKYCTLSLTIITVFETNIYCVVHIQGNWLKWSLKLIVMISLSIHMMTYQGRICVQCVTNGIEQKIA